ncbi:unnamed protein product (macronuclear) [Paramecium tetraurelia]|uniref:RNA helicase n=1 Tax=Paramecium tetraurelia TaxID=5888 RepID=A0BEU9_PARTE|nr:uncharacterized protein GSPATT00028099001 [Paramecium tetraurelia]CAK57066.1 unnamed protein product [Paramecium tetraurelia]|eukprot:XP_001424464.1 hypothetical protein (macronuclear) [Paramecium tetraurelia strain d4-2]
MDIQNLYGNVEWKTNEEPIIQSTFESMKLRKELLRGINAFGFIRPLEVQQRALVPLIQGRDVVIQNFRSTGKTTVMSLSVLSIFDLSVKKIQVLILQKTRKLTEENAGLIMALGKFLNVSIHACSEGNSIQDDISVVQQGVQIVLGTPDRVFELVQRKEISFAHLKMIILDEADEMLIDESKSLVYCIFKYLPPKPQYVLVTATLSQDILDFIEKFFNNPLVIMDKRNELTLEGIQQFFIQVDKEDWKFETLCDLYEIASITQSVIFCQTKQKCEWLVNKMLESNFTVVQIHEGMSQQQRNEIMRDYKQGIKRVLIGTDILRRCLDIEYVSLIINYDVPTSKELYILRIGRKGKFGRKGVAITLIRSEDFKILNQIEQYYSTQIKELPINFTDIL